MESIVLTGHDLTSDQIYQIVHHRTPVEIAPEAQRRLTEGRALLLELADSGIPIYGVNTGVGWNKDEEIPPEHYPIYNRNLILSHSVGLPPYASEADVRAILLSRLNIFLVGCTGVAPEIPDFYAKMLNKGIHPLIPQVGSVGEADIGLMSFVGLAIIGEGQVWYNGELMKSADALAAAGLEPLELGPKDGLSIVSSNAVGAGQGILILKEIEDLMDAADLIYCSSLEALNGNMHPFDPRNLILKRNEGAIATGETLRSHLIGSYLHQPDENEERALQDPLCFRDVVHIHGAVRELLAYTRERLVISLNAAEDNPGLVLEDRTILPTSNFEPINWVLGMEAMAIALSHVSRAAGLRIIKLANPNFTHLPRFLAPPNDEEQVLGFTTIQKTYTALDAEIRHLCNPVSMDTFALAGEIEDKSTNSPYVVQRLRRIADALRDIFALELLHAAQAQDFRLEQGKALGQGTQIAYTNVRKVVAFLDHDRILSNDILTLRDLIKSGNLMDGINR